MHSAERLLVCLLLLVAFALPARGQAGLPLARVLHAARDVPDLLRQIDVELRKNDLKPNDVVCGAGQLGNQWRFLAGGALRMPVRRTPAQGRGRPQLFRC